MFDSIGSPPTEGDGVVADVLNRENLDGGFWGDSAYLGIPPDFLQFEHVPP